MKAQKTLKTIALLLVMTLVSFSCSDDDNDNIITQPMALNIVETAESVVDLSSLFLPQEQTFRFLMVEVW